MAKSLILEETALVERRLLLLVALVETLAEKMMMMMSYYESPYPLQPNYKYLSGLAILPSIAEAAAVAGDER